MTMQLDTVWQIWWNSGWQLKWSLSVNNGVSVLSGQETVQWVARFASRIWFPLSKTLVIRGVVSYRSNQWCIISGATFQQKIPTAQVIFGQMKYRFTKTMNLICRQGYITKWFLFLCRATFVLKILMFNVQF